MSKVMLPLFLINCYLVRLSYFMKGVIVHEAPYIIKFTIHNSFDWMTDQIKVINIILY